MCFESDVLKTLNGIKTKVQQMKRYIEVEKNQYKKRYTILKQKKKQKIFDADYDYSPDFKFEKSNIEVGNLNTTKTKL